jgi:hypothetical protein
MRRDGIVFKLATLTTFAAAAFAALALTCTAATATLTKTQVIKQGSVICKAAERRVESAPQPRSQTPFAANAPKGDRQRAITFLQVYAAALESVRSGLGSLAAPPQGKQLLDTFIADLGPTITMFRTAHTDAVNGAYKAAMTHTMAAFTLFEKASINTHKYGFAKGVCQAGA